VQKIIALNNAFKEVVQTKLSLNQHEHFVVKSFNPTITKQCYGAAGSRIILVEPEPTPKLICKIQ
jgi:hypothetical protein